MEKPLLLWHAMLKILLLLDVVLSDRGIINGSVLIVFPLSGNSYFFRKLRKSLTLIKQSPEKERLLPRDKTDRSINGCYLIYTFIENYSQAAEAYLNLQVFSLLYSFLAVILTIFPTLSFRGKGYRLFEGRLISTVNTLKVEQNLHTVRLSQPFKHLI